jgi:hypothetical protein
MVLLTWKISFALATEVLMESDTSAQSVLYDKRKHYPLLEPTLGLAIYHRKTVAAQQNP